jgi:hypothetical protein
MFAATAWPALRHRRVMRSYPRREHRDAYKYLHDQTVRLMNQGLSGAEIAEVLDRCRRCWPAVVQPRLLRHDEPQQQGGLSALHGLVRRQPGASGNPLPPEPAGEALRRGDGRRRRRASPSASAAAVAAGEYRWAAMLLNHVVFADAGEHAPPSERCWPRSTRSSATRPRPAPGATSTSPARRNCGTAWWTRGCSA